MNPIEPIPAPRAPRRAAALWRRFHGVFRMLCLLTVGVLALGATANAAPSNQPGAIYDSVAPLELEQIVATSKGVYGLSVDHRGVYEWSPGQDGWKRVFGGTAKLYGGGDTVYATDPSTGSIWKYNGDGWDRIGNPGLTFAAANEKLYGISPDGGGVWEYSGKKDVWNKIGGPAKDIYIGPAKKVIPGFGSDKTRYGLDNVLYATNRDTGDLYKYGDKPYKWTKAGDPGTTFAVTDNNVYGLNSDGSVFERDPKKGDWKTVGERAEHIVASNTLYAVNRDTHNLYQYAGTPHQWNRISGPAAAFATSGDDLYRLAPDRRSVQKYDGDGKNDQWLDLRGPAVPAGREEKIARLNSLIQLGPEAKSAYQEALDAHRAGKPDPYEFRWTTNKCNSPAPNSFGGYDFTPACVRHDFGYRNYRDLFGEDNFRTKPNGRALIDEIFLQDMNAICDAQGQPSPYVPVPDISAAAGCKAAAQTYYRVVAGTALAEKWWDKLFG
ncbi:phospholipase A2 [Streptomyces sp. NPDC002643]